jgi:pilus assembly protein Flp/PilA
VPGAKFSRRGPDDVERQERKLKEAMRKMLCRILRDETGGEVNEYALILGLIIVAAIAIIGTVGTRVLARWTSVDSSL